MVVVTAWPNGGPSASLGIATEVVVALAIVIERQHGYGGPTDSSKEQPAVRRTDRYRAIRRLRSRSSLARPKPCLLTNLIRVTVPSVGPFDHFSFSAASTAARSLRSPVARLTNGANWLASATFSQ